MVENAGQISDSKQSELNAISRLDTDLSIPIHINEKTECKP